LGKKEEGFIAVSMNMVRLVAIGAGSGDVAGAD